MANREPQVGGGGAPSGRVLPEYGLLVRLPSRPVSAVVGVAKGML